MMKFSRLVYQPVENIKKKAADDMCLKKLSACAVSFKYFVLLKKKRDIFSSLVWNNEFYQKFAWRIPGGWKKNGLIFLIFFLNVKCYSIK